MDLTKSSDFFFCLSFFKWVYNVSFERRENHLFSSFIGPKSASPLVFLLSPTLTIPLPPPMIGQVQVVASGEPIENVASSSKTFHKWAKVASWAIRRMLIANACQRWKWMMAMWHYHPQVGAFHLHSGQSHCQTNYTGGHKQSMLLAFLLLLLFISFNIKRAFKKLCTLQLNVYHLRL